MRIEPELDEVVNGPRGMLRAIEVCLAEQCLVSAVTLIFSAIDALAALTRPKDAPETDRRIFIDWVDRYIKPEEKLECNSIELYSARCGVLHTSMPDSRLTRYGEARPIIYEWRGGPAADASMPLPDGALILFIEDLHSAFCAAVRQFIIDSTTQHDLKGRVLHHLKTLLCYRPWPQLSVHTAA